MPLASAKHHHVSVTKTSPTFMRIVLFHECFLFVCRYCGRNGPGTVTSTGPSLFIRFHSDSSVNATGFIASYQFVTGMDVVLLFWVIFCPIDNCLTFLTSHLKWQWYCYNQFICNHMQCLNQWSLAVINLFGDIFFLISQYKCSKSDTKSDHKHILYLTY